MIIQNRVFYNPENPGEISLLGEIWIYKAVIMWGLCCLLIGAPILGYIYIESGCEVTLKDFQCAKFLFGILTELFFTLVFVFVWCLGSTFAIFICEIVFFSPCAFILFSRTHERYIGSSKSVWAKKAFDFILDNKSLYTKINDTGNDNNNEKVQMHVSNKVLHSKQEQMFRLIYCNYSFIHIFNWAENKKLIEFLDSHVDTEWNDITLDQLRENSSEHVYGLIKDEIIEMYTDIIGDSRRSLESARLRTNNHRVHTAYRLIVHGYAYCMIWLFLPMFLLSRLFSTFFPLVAIIYFNKISILQWILTLSHGIFICSWIICAIRCIYFYHWTIHLFPGHRTWDATSSTPSQDEITKQYIRLNSMQHFYNKRLNEKYLDKKRREIVIKYLGKDIGGLIVSYWPLFEFKQWLDEFVIDSMFC